MGLGKIISSNVPLRETLIGECTAMTEDLVESKPVYYLYAACSEVCEVLTEGEGVAMTCDSAINVSCTCFDCTAAGEACGVERRDTP